MKLEQLMLWLKALTCVYFFKAAGLVFNQCILPILHDRESTFSNAIKLIVGLQYLEKYVNATSLLFAYGARSKQWNYVNCSINKCTYSRSRYSTFVMGTSNNIYARKCFSSLLSLDARRWNNRVYNITWTLTMLRWCSTFQIDSDVFIKTWNSS